MLKGSKGFDGLMVMGVFLVLMSFTVNMSRLLSCLLVIEKMNMLVLFSCLISDWDGVGVMFMALLVIFTIEVALALVVLTRLWSYGNLIDMVGV